MTIELIQKKEKYLLHIRNREYVAIFYERLRHIRGSKTQMLLAYTADVPQPYISRVEAGTTHGIGQEALQRILEAYREIGNANQNCS